MNRRAFLKRCGLGAVALGGARVTQAAPGKRPNFVFFLIDDLGWADLGCYGSTFYETPNLDRFAASGMRFTDAYAACPVCSPTRAAIMSGKHPARLNITDWIPGSNPKNQRLLGPEDLHQLPHSEVTIAEILKAKGYTTFFAGKWHLGGEGYFPEDQGFDINKGGHHKGSPPGGYYSPYKNPCLTDGPEGEYLPDRLADESIRFLEDQGEDPFLLYLSFYTVHTPIQACKRHLEKFQKKAATLPSLGEDALTPEHDGFTRARQDGPEYASMVHAMDENVGRVLDALDRLGLDDNTVVIFTSDNGGLSTKPGKRLSPTNNGPLRAGKGWCYEGGIRTCLIVRAPGVTRPGSESSEPVYSTDYYPTMLELAGLPPMPEQHRDGLSLASVLKGASLSRQALYWHYPHYHGSAWKPGAAVRAGDWKLVAFYHHDKVELYNLKDDLGERNNLAESMPEKRREMEALLRRWQQDVGARMPIPNPKYKGG